MVKVDEARELVKRLVRERLAEKAGVQNIVYHGEEVNVTIAEDGSKRFNLPRLRKAYAVMSGRVYEREYKDDVVIRVEVGDQQESTMTQLNYKSELEEVDTSIYRNKLVCACGNIRYVKNADRFQVTRCKPCTIRERNKRRKKRVE